MIRRLALLLVLAPLPAHAQEGPSFDCTKAESAAETLVCEDADLAALDRLVADLVALAEAEHLIDHGVGLAFAAGGGEDDELELSPGGQVEDSDILGGFARAQRSGMAGEGEGGEVGHRRGGIGSAGGGWARRVSPFQWAHGQEGTGVGMR